MSLGFIYLFIYFNWLLNSSRKINRRRFHLSMASSSHKSAAEVNLLGKRKVEDGLETKSMLKRPKEEETTKEQIEASVELSETKSDEANFFEEATAAVSNNFVRYIFCKFYVQLSKHLGSYYLRRQRQWKELKLPNSLLFLIISQTHLAVKFRKQKSRSLLANSLAKLKYQICKYCTFPCRS